MRHGEDPMLDGSQGSNILLSISTIGDLATRLPIDPIRKCPNGNNGTGDRTFVLRSRVNLQ